MNAAAALAVVVDILEFCAFAVASIHRRRAFVSRYSRSDCGCVDVRCCVIGGRVLVNYASEKFTKNTLRKCYDRSSAHVGECSKTISFSPMRAPMPDSRANAKVR